MSDQAEPIPAPKYRQMGLVGLTVSGFVLGLCLRVVLWGAILAGMLIPAVICLLGALLTAFGALLLTPFIPALPVLSSGDVPAVTLLALGAGWAVLGSVQSARLGPGGWGKAAVVFVGVLTVLASAGTTAWALKLSYMIPPKPSLEVGQPLPPFKVNDATGREISNETLMGKRAVLLFFRGTW